MAFDWEHIRLDIQDGVATVTLDRPRARNAFKGSMRKDLLEAIEHVGSRSSSDVRVLIITGAGKAFCAGGDVKFMATAKAADVEPLILQGRDVIITLAHLPLPTIAAVNGVAVGAGLGLALACDLRIATESARLGATFARIGLHPDWGTCYFLTRLAGSAAARELVFTGRLVDANEAFRLGLVNAVIRDDSFHAAVHAKAEAICAAAPIAVARAKRTLALAETASLDEVLAVEQAAQLACFDTEDAREGLKAFVDKRVPSFRGK